MRFWFHQFSCGAGKLLFGVALLFPVIAGSAEKRGQDSASLPKPSSVVKPAVYVSIEPVPVGKEFQVAVVAQIMQGFHMNSHNPSEDYLIATTLVAQPPAGIQLLDTIYPDGRDEKFSFSPDRPLNVYTGTVTIRLKVKANPDAPVGTVDFPLTLRYQACNDTTCLPPVKLPVTARFAVAPAGAKSHAVHGDIFSASSAKN
jgi:hypothetical protein